MRTLNIVVVEALDARVHGALSVAVSAAALGRTVRLFFQGGAVSALAGGRIDPSDAVQPGAGVPTLAELFDQCRELGVPLFACETGLHMTGLTARALRDGVETSGLIGFLGGQAEGELIVV